MIGWDGSVRLGWTATLIAAAAVTTTVGCAAIPRLAAPERSVSLKPSRHDSADLDILREELISHPDDPELLKECGYALHRAGRPRAAAKLYERAVFLHSKDARLRYLLAHAYATYWDPRALGEATTAVELDGSVADAHALRGILLQREGHSDQARESLQTAWRMSPPSVAAGLALARWETRRGRHDEAARILQVCAIHKPQNAEIQSALADSLERTGDVRGAARIWQRLSQRGEGGAVALARLDALTQDASGEVAGGERYLEAAKRIDPRIQADARSHREHVESVEIEYPPLLADGSSGKTRLGALPVAAYTSINRSREGDDPPTGTAGRESLERP